VAIAVLSLRQCSLICKSRWVSLLPKSDELEETSDHICLSGAETTVTVAHLRLQMKERAIKS